MEENNATQARARLGAGACERADDTTTIPPAAFVMMKPVERRCIHGSMNSSIDLWMHRSIDGRSMDGRWMDKSKKLRNESMVGHRRRKQMNDKYEVKEKTNYSCEVRDDFGEVRTLRKGGSG